MDQIEDILVRGVANIIPGKEALREALSSRKLNVYLGIDPTATQIHLGHAFPLRKLQKLSEMGHHVTFLIGDFTALIGDTSDKNDERPVLTYEQIESNFQTYKQQASKILDFSKITVHHNSEWLSKLNFSDVVKLTRHFSLNDFISRELIKKRLEAGKSVSLPEVLYPVMQGYDSYFMDTDLQLGGTDQTFNMQAGRTIQKNLRSKESFVMANGFLEGTDGRKMSKSWGNAIWLNDSPADIYGKVMSLKDELIIQYFTLATNVSLDIISEHQHRLESGENPMNLKKELARQITLELHGESAAAAAADEFTKTFSEKQIDFSQNIVSVHSPNLVDALIEAKLVESKSEARRLIAQGGISLNGEKVADEQAVLSPGSPANIQVGKRKFAQVTLS